MNNAYFRDKAYATEPCYLHRMVFSTANLYHNCLGVSGRGKSTTLLDSKQGKHLYRPSCTGNFPISFKTHMPCNKVCARMLAYMHATMGPTDYMTTFDAATLFLLLSALAFSSCPCMSLVSNTSPSARSRQAMHCQAPTLDENPRSPSLRCCCKHCRNALWQVLASIPLPATQESCDLQQASTPSQGSSPASRLCHISTSTCLRLTL